MTYKLIRSKRKTIGIEVRREGVIVRAPFHATTAQIEELLQSKSAWIASAQAKLAAAPLPLVVDRLTVEEIRALADKALQYIPGRVKLYAAKLGVTYGRITIRNQKSRWGSCSSKGNLNFNCLLMLTPPEVIDSVVVHELCHRKVMNHGKDFYALVLSVFPNYRFCDKWLKQNGETLMRRMIG